MNHTCISAVLVLSSVLVFTAGPTVSRATAQAESPRNGKLAVDDSTPEAAIRTFFGALAKGDSRSALQLLTSPDKMAEWAEIQAKTSLAFKHLGMAAVARFGDEGKSLQLPVPAELSLQKLETVKPVLDGDTAKWPVNPKAPLKMKSVDGHWKLEIYESFPSPSDVKQANSVHGRIAAYVAKIAADLEEGKFKSLAEVREEFKRQREAMNRDLAKPAP